VSETDTLRALLIEALELIEAETERQDGRDRFDMGCGNCIAGLPVRHSFGCRAETAIREGAQ
jgi:hypothetical protein